MSEPQPSDRERMTFPHHPRPAGGISNTLANTKLHILNDLVSDELVSSVRFRTPVSQIRTPTHSLGTRKGLCSFDSGVVDITRLETKPGGRQAGSNDFLEELKLASSPERGPGIASVLRIKGSAVFSRHPALFLADEEDAPSK
jgi:hypothetical protein